MRQVFLQGFGFQYKELNKTPDGYNIEFFYAALCLVLCFYLLFRVDLHEKLVIDVFGASVRQPLAFVL